MFIAPDIFGFRTGRATVMIGPLAAFGEVKGETLIGSAPDVARHIELLFASRRESHALRQFCVRWGLDTHSVSYVDDRSLRSWLLDRVRQGSIGVAVLPDAAFVAGTIQERAKATSVRLTVDADRAAVRIRGTVRTGPAQLIEAVQAERKRARTPGKGAAAPPMTPKGPVLTSADVRNMDLDDRFLEVLKRAVESPGLSPDEKERLTELLHPQGLSLTIGALVAWTATHGVGVGFLLDVGSAALGASALGLTTIEGVKELAECLKLTREARDSADLDKASEKLRLAISRLGPLGFFRLTRFGSSGPTGWSRSGQGLARRNRGIDRQKPAERLVARPSAKLDSAAAGAPGPTGSSEKAAKSGSPKPGDPVDHAKNPVVQKSPTLKQQLKALEDAGWKIRYGEPGKGSYCNKGKKEIVVDAKSAGDPSRVTQTLAHEVGHANHKEPIDKSSRQAYIDSKLSDEGAATLNNVKIQREIKNNGGPDIGIAGRSSNHKKYNEAYDQYEKDGDAAKARTEIGKVFGQGETTSTTKQKYEDYYGDQYDKNYGKATKKP